MDGWMYRYVGVGCVGKERRCAEGWHTHWRYALHNRPRGPEGVRVRELVVAADPGLPRALVLRVIPAWVAAGDPLHLLAGDRGKVFDADIGLEGCAPSVPQDRLEHVLVYQLLRIEPVGSSRERWIRAGGQPIDRKRRENPGLCQCRRYGSQGRDDLSRCRASKDKNNLCGLQR